MHTAFFEDLFNMHEEDLPGIPHRVDSCPPTPHYSPRLSFDLSSLLLNEEQGELLAFNITRERTEDKPSEGEQKMPPEAVAGKAKSKRTKKAAQKAEPIAPIDCEEKKTLRAEKNRKFAKESRDRKRQYVQNLEVEVKELRREVQLYRARLQKYALIEKHKNTGHYDIYSLIAAIYKEMNERNQPITNNSLFIEALRRTKMNHLLERQMAVEQLTREMTNIVFPDCLKFAVWSFENNIDLYDAAKFSKILGTSEEQAKAVIEYMKKLYPDKKVFRKIQILTTNTGKKVKEMMRQVILSQKRIFVELQRLESYVSDNLSPNYTMKTLEDLANLVPYIMPKPEFKEMLEDNLGLDALSLGKEETEDFKNMDS
eukprot:TRINITY_DN7062_c0_g1_i17.p1 TRINITY_DN7062_c0_g1~~TRINITY_DN7062_c0_g1_i17.p1  ORF type:complete len:370 (+),score=112.25 TRINITY_DN7062_c0_g1_i17:98-1207(+)